MKKSQLVQLIREELRGFSKYAPQGVTKGGTTDDFMQILTAIAKGDKEKYQGDPDKGNKILDKANPENVERILRGEEPIYKESIFSPNYVTNLRPEGSWNELINVSIYSQEEGGYKARLEVSAATGHGMARRIQPRRITAVKPLEEFTPEYVVGEVENIYNLSDKDRQTLTDFVNSIPSKIG